MLKITGSWRGSAAVYCAILERPHQTLLLQRAYTKKVLTHTANLNLSLASHPIEHETTISSWVHLDHTLYQNQSGLVSLKAVAHMIWSPSAVDIESEVIYLFQRSLTRAKNREWMLPEVPAEVMESDTKLMASSGTE